MATLWIISNDITDKIQTKINFFIHVAIVWNSKREKNENITINTCKRRY